MTLKRLALVPKPVISWFSIFVLLLAFTFLAPVAPVFAADPEPVNTSASELTRESREALDKLYKNVPTAKAISEKAYAILVFPSVVKAGLLIGGQYGEGTLFRSGKPIGYYNTGGVSYGLQAGAQTYGYALMLMNKTAVDDLNAAGGFEVGVGPSVVLIDDENAYGKNITTKTTDEDVYAFIFNQAGLMAGLGVQGNKITPIKPQKP
jgi:lipid-binding SYLF domain-containing protein